MIGYESAWPPARGLDIEQLRASGCVEGPFRRAGAYPLAGTVRGCLARLWRALAAFLTNPKGSL